MPRNLGQGAHKVQQCQCSPRVMRITSRSTKMSLPARIRESDTCHRRGSTMGQALTDVVEVV